MEKEITVPRSEKIQDASRIMIGNVIDRLDTLLENRRVVVITDENLAREHASLVGRWPAVVIGTGEKNKTIDTVRSICSQLLEMGVDRGSYLLGIGGGIVTDITGFVASVYMRGVSGFGFVATTLLAQVDASVGGKNGVNLEGYKNIIGVFNQPDFVLCDTGILATLPVRELRAGMAEAIKCGLIRRPGLFELFEGKDFGDFESNTELLQQAVTESVALKAEVVEADEREMGERKLLNLGHTFAHAVEKNTDRYLHGEAVAIGMGISARISAKLGLLNEAEVERIEKVITRMGLPVRAPQEIPAEKLLTAVSSDKKRESGTIDFILMDGIGRAVIRKMGLRELYELAQDIL